MPVILGGVLLSVQVLGCRPAKGGQRGAVRQYPLTLALSEPLGPAGTPLPEDIKPMLMPLKAERCPKYLFLPEVKLVRLDLQGAQPEELKLPRAQNKIQIAAGKPADPERERLERERAVEEQMISATMARPRGNEAVAQQGIQRFLGSPTDHRLFTFGLQQATSDESGEAKITSVHDFGDLSKAIGAALCDKPGAPPLDHPPTFVILYRQDALPGESTPAPIVEVTDNPAPPSVQEANELFAQLSKEVEEAIAGRANKKAVHARLAKAQAEMTWDYRFAYERAKLAVYGTHNHDEAFNHLARAAEIAIENGNADDMASRLAIDAEEGGVLHRLSHGHSEWSAIRNALATGNAGIVRGMS